MPTFRNNRKAPDGRRVGGRLVWVQPGEEIDLDNPPESKKRDDVEPESASSEGDRFDNMSEDELRDYIEAETGDKPHWNAKPETLREKAREI